ncbi:L-rhamnose mutarotase [Paenibacillus castaneae]|uniref:L-rhamnose mutarotase n=1 Tax=Paenibacillus castaneae TaxID=474957 RepID=UPI00141B6259|nr:L-rhamnose mutarotase [Paenibacillus castaneae]NIK78746.1 L-rhamnose mutarotase [Paenibacillus castaneae]
MSTTRTIECKIAKLYADQVEHYEQLHNEIPELNKKYMQEAGIISLRIFRDGLSLFMIVESDSTFEVQGRFVDPVVERRWQQLTGACFSEMWVDANEIFTFTRRED